MTNFSADLNEYPRVVDTETETMSDMQKQTHKMAQETLYSSSDHIE